MGTDIYTGGGYLAAHPTWHAEDSPWKAFRILELLKRNNLAPKSICEVGCGAGEILRQLQSAMSSECEFWGYEISPQAFQLCQQGANAKLHFRLQDFMAEQTATFDLILVIDVIEHLEDYYHFMRQLKARSHYKILHIPLELSVQSVLRRGRLNASRETDGHIHYFTRETALQALIDSGYEIVDQFYTGGAGVDPRIRSTKALFARVPRRILFRINPDLAARILGGCTMMVLAK